MKVFVAALFVAFFVGAGVSVFTTPSTFGFVSSAAVRVISSGPREIGATQLDGALKQKGTVIVKFYADWCPPCRKTKPNYNKVALETSGVAFYELSTESKGFNNSTADKLIDSIPTIIAFKNGKEVDRLNGYQTYEQLKAFVEKNK